MADWSDLAFDVLEHITSLLPLPDYHRFSAVCKNWNFVANQKRYSPAPQLPWLVLGEDEKTRTRKFYSLSEDRHYSIDIPELYGRCIRGSSHGWLFAIDINITAILINPFTREFYELPPFPSYIYNNDVKLVEKAPNNRTDHPGHFTFEEMQRLIVYKGILSHDPKERSDFMALILFGDTKRVAIWKPGSPSWMIIKGPHCAMKDATFWNGNFYVISPFNAIHVVELGSDPKLIRVEPHIMPRIDSSHTYLVDFKGHLLHIDRFQENVEERLYITKRFHEVLELDIQRKKVHRWNDIDNRAIFIGANSPIVIDANQISGCKRNAFYFTDLALTYSAKKFGCGDLGIFDYITKTITTYYPPDIIHPRVSNPVWITPNPW